MTHNYQDLITLFNECFFHDYNTVLVKGDQEPIYLPQNSIEPHNRIFFARGYYASALHAISHWLIAGQERRKLEDFGYWYEPDGRTADQQKLFQTVEVKPQALECILSHAANFRFFISNDNVGYKQEDTQEFKKAVFNQVQLYVEKGLPLRAKLFKEKLNDFYHTKKELSIENFSFESL